MDGNYIEEHSKASDIWSFGMIVYELIYGRLPFEYLDDIPRLMNDIDGFRFNLEKVSFKSEKEELLGLVISLCLQYDPFKRPSMAEILQILEEPTKGQSTVTDTKYYVETFDLQRLFLLIIFKISYFCCFVSLLTNWSIFVLILSFSVDFLMYFSLLFNYLYTDVFA